MDLIEGSSSSSESVNSISSSSNISEDEGSENQRSIPTTAHHHLTSTALPNNNTADSINKPKSSIILIDADDKDKSASNKDVFIRTTPHTRGNWSGHVFCQVHHQDQEEASSFMIQGFRNELARVGWTGAIILHAKDDLHVSLSRPFVLQQANIENFVRELTNQLMGVPKTTLHVMSCYQNKHPLLLVNDSGTRSFWGWSLSTNPVMQHIIACVDRALAKYQQPAYYDPPLLHVSLASIPGVVPPEFSTERIVDWMNMSTDICDEEGIILPNPVPVEQVICTFGTTKKYIISLS